MNYKLVAPLLAISMLGQSAVASVFIYSPAAESIYSGFAVWYYPSITGVDNVFRSYTIDGGLESVANNSNLIYFFNYEFDYRDPKKVEYNAKRVFWGCPAGARYFGSGPGWSAAGYGDFSANGICLTDGFSVKKKARTKEPDICRGNPIAPLSGVKVENIDLPISFAGRFGISLHYDSQDLMKYEIVGSNGPVDNWRTGPEPSNGALGMLWRSGFFRPSPADFFLNSGGSLDWGNGLVFNSSEDFTFDRGEKTLRVTRISTSETSYFEDVDNNGWREVSRYFPDGRRLNFSYDRPTDSHPSLRMLPSSLTDEYGRRITFEYSIVDNLPLLGRIQGEDSGAIGLSYIGRLLKSIQWQDGTTKTFLYEHATLPYALTGILDETGARKSTFGYYENGVAAFTESGSGINRYEMAYDTPPRLVQIMVALNNGDYQVTEKMIPPTGVRVNQPNGIVQSLVAADVNDVPRLAEQSQAAGSGCEASISRKGYDQIGNTAWKEDFRGYRTCYANDLTRNLEVGRVEGLVTNSSCDAVTAEGATLSSGARRISTQWHPSWRLATKVAEPHRLTTKVYNGQPDPLNSGTTALCAPANATLPDGSPLVVLCKQVEQATTDANGALGFSAAVDASVPARVQQWTYNQYGQVLTAKDALNNTTSYSYYPSTTADHTMGDLATATNALGQALNYTKYNPAGQWLTMVDASTSTTTYAYDLRQRLTSVTTAGATTSYDYWPTGLLKTVTMPDASAVNYGYDDAHRLTSVTDNLGNKITYTLDNSGNRTSENVTDPGGKLARTLTRVPDALNRIQQTIGRP